jgi:hypothetical protein
LPVISGFEGERVSTRAGNAQLQRRLDDAFLQFAEIYDRATAVGSISAGQSHDGAWKNLEPQDDLPPMMVVPSSSSASSEPFA